MAGYNRENPGVLKVLSKIFASSLTISKYFGAHYFSMVKIASFYAFLSSFSSIDVLLHEATPFLCGIWYTTNLILIKGKQIHYKLFLFENPFWFLSEG